MDSNLKTLDKDLMLELECPVCLEYLTPPIVICENGHSICNACKNKLTRCPNCRKPFLNVRNLALESLTRAVVPTAEKPVVVEKTYKCPFAQISNEDCSWNGKLKNMKKHIRNFHDHPRDAHSSEGSFNVILTSLSQSRHYRKAQFVNDEVFYITWEIKDGNFYCAVLNIGSQSNASNFSYQFSLSSKNESKKISMIFPMKSIEEDLERILKPGQCVLLHYETVLEFLDTHNHLSCEFEIKATSSIKSFAGSVVQKNQNMATNGESSSENSSHNGFDNSRGRGGRGGRRGRGGRQGRGGRRGHDENSRGGFFKPSRFGWSMSDIQDDAHYRLERAESARDDSVFEKIARSFEENASSRSSARHLSISSQSSVSSIGSNSCEQHPRHRNVAAKERDVRTMSSQASSESKPTKATGKSPEVMNQACKAPTGNTSSGLYPKLFTTKSTEEKPVVCNTSQASNVLPTENVRLSVEKTPTAPPEELWRCPLCNQNATKKKHNLTEIGRVMPPGKTWLCPMCGYWR
ncbi:hypothetical protein C0J52_20416 [Blattella germanica]|nr:hypothetical protein C0J52_20416 [Blattella germanica]